MSSCSNVLFQKNKIITLCNIPFKRFEHDDIQYENLRIYVYNEEKFHEITVRLIGHFAYNQR